eukprot:7385486-Prymnesium_polylepis.1
MCDNAGVMSRRVLGYLAAEPGAELSLGDGGMPRFSQVAVAAQTADLSNALRESIITINVNRRPHAPPPLR